MGLKVIKTKSDHQESLKEIERLMIIDPDPGSEDADRLEVLALLIENYEKEHFPIELPDPISTIKFVMEQRGLTRTDLVPYIGSKAKVSEILAGKRPLSKRMMRNLHNGLGIPAQVLLKEESFIIPAEEQIEWDKFPLAAIHKRGWIRGFSGNLNDLKEYAEENLRPIIELLKTNCPYAVLSRSSASHFQSGHPVNYYALTFWQAKVVEYAVRNRIKARYSTNIGKNFVNQIAQLTVFDDGPFRAKELLNENGIYFIIVPHLKNTYLDGAAMLLKNRAPIIALTLRYNRLDNFWFSLLHELAHVITHLNENEPPFFDDFEYKNRHISEYEKEADLIASEALLPESVWPKTESRKAMDYDSSKIRKFAKDLKIHESILAGRIRFDMDNFALFPRLLGNGIPSRILNINLPKKY